MSLRILFLCSGGGGNLRFICEAVRLGLLRNTEVCGVIVDRDCAAGHFAEHHGIAVASCNFSERGQLEVKRAMLSYEPDVVVSNVHKILTPELLEAFLGKVINLHYSMLPAFGGVIGAKAVSLALEYGASMVGTTVHWVNEQVDAGKPLIQAAIPIRGTEALPELMDIVFRAGCISLMTGIQIAGADATPMARDLCSVIEVSGRPVLFTPFSESFPEFQDEAFWRRFK